MPKNYIEHRFKFQDTCSMMKSIRRTFYVQELDVGNPPKSQAIGFATE